MVGNLIAYFFLVGFRGFFGGRELGWLFFCFVQPKVEVIHQEDLSRRIFQPQVKLMMQHCS